MISLDNSSAWRHSCAWRVWRSTLIVGLVREEDSKEGHEGPMDVSACFKWFLVVFQVAKQWHDYNREEFHYVQVLKSLKEPLVFQHTTDFDENGIFYWIGSNAKYVYIYNTPCTCAIHVQVQNVHTVY